MKRMDSIEQKPDQRAAEASTFEQPQFQSPHFQHPQKRKLILCLLLALATLALYNPVTRAPFLNYDDQVYVTENAQVRAGLTWNTIVWSFRTPRAVDWHPLTWLSYLLDRQMFGMKPAGYHLTNVLLHTANGVLLFLILAGATGFVWRSWAVAALFALHPINVESVAWIAERKNVLSMFFFLVALAAYGWYARRPGIGRYLAVTGAYILALMSKAQVITFPFALLLLDYWPLGRIGQSITSTEEVGGKSSVAPAHGAFSWNLIWEKVPWVVLSAVSAIITMKTGGAAFNYTVATGATPSEFPLRIRLATAAIGYVKYLGKAFWPIDLAMVYPHPGLGTSVRTAVLSTLVIIAITVLAVIFGFGFGFEFGQRRRPFLLVGWFWFLGTMLPMSGIVTIGPHAMADRYAYIPLLGIFVIVCWGVAELIQRWKVPAVVYAAVAAAVLLALGSALHRQVSFWSDNVTLWAHTVAITRDNFIGEENLAMALITQGEAAQALPHFQRAKAMWPADPLATLNIATYDQMLGHYQAALDGYAAVVHSPVTAPSLRATALANSGYAHLSLKQYDDAQRDFAAALKDQPEDSAAYRGLGLVAQRAGNIAEATKDYERSVELQPSPVGFLLLGNALEIAGQPEAAHAAQSRATRMTQDLNGDIATVRQLLSN
jgi:Tfp pilus assembly protein PilF